MKFEEISGEWKNGKFFGKGIFYFDENSYYKGEIKDNIKDGDGMMVRPVVLVF